jgi:hypothetical protein
MLRQPGNFGKIAVFQNHAHETIFDPWEVSRSCFGSKCADLPCGVFSSPAATIKASTVSDLATAVFETFASS